MKYLEIAPVYTDGPDAVQAVYDGSVPEGERFYAFGVYAREQRGEFLVARWLFDSPDHDGAKRYAEEFAPGVEVRDYVTTPWGQRTVDLTPVALKTPEGARRANTAVDALEQTSSVVRGIKEAIADLLIESDGDLSDSEKADLRDLLNEYKDAKEKHSAASEELMRSIVGQPSAKE